MDLQHRRRRFLQMASAMGLGAELGPWSELMPISPLRADDARVQPEMVKFRPEIEPVVRLIEETPPISGAGGYDLPAQEGAIVQEPALRAVSGGHPQRQAAGRSGSSSTP